MKISRIDLVAQNGNTGEHYKYEEVADRLWSVAHPIYNPASSYEVFIKETVKILVEAFPNDNA